MSSKEGTSIATATTRGERTKRTSAPRASHSLRLRPARQPNFRDRPKETEPAIKDSYTQDGNGLRSGRNKLSDLGLDGKSASDAEHLSRCVAAYSAVRR